MSTTSFNTWTRGGLPLLFVLVMYGQGCAGEQDHDSADLECSDHGELHGDHCHCDAGFSPSEDGLSCVQEQEADPEDNNAHDNNAHDNNHDPMIVDEQPGELSFSPDAVRAATGQANDGTRVWLLSAVDGDAVLSMELYEAYGALTSPGELAITQVETSYESCGTCIILQTGCTEHGDHFHCSRTFMPRAQGQVRFDALGTRDGEPLAGELTDLVFQEVTITQDYTTTPVSGGQALRIASWSFAAELEPPEDNPEPCGGHGQLHGDHCDCDPGYRQAPGNPLLCIPD